MYFVTKITFFSTIAPHAKTPEDKSGTKTRMSVVRLVRWRSVSGDDRVLGGGREREAPRRETRARLCDVQQKRGLHLKTLTFLLKNSTLGKCGYTLTRSGKRSLLLKV